MNAMFTHLALLDPKAEDMRLDADAERNGLGLLRRFRCGDSRGRRSHWTLDPEKVTCKRCLAKLAKEATP